MFKWTLNAGNFIIEQIFAGNFSPCGQDVDIGGAVFMNRIWRGHDFNRLYLLRDGYYCLDEYMGMCIPETVAWGKYDRLGPRLTFGRNEAFPEPSPEKYNLSPLEIAVTHGTPYGFLIGPSSGPIDSKFSIFKNVFFFEDRYGEDDEVKIRSTFETFKPITRL